MATASEAERRSVAHQLKQYLQLKPKTSPERAQRYTDKILSGKYDVWTLQLAVSLRDETQDIFAGLEDTPKPKAPDRPDVSTLLLLEDENDRAASAPTRKGQPRIAQDSETIHTRLHEKSTSSDKDIKHFVAIHEPYPPSTISVRELQPMNLADLKQEIHHRGNVLRMRRCGPIIQSGSGTLVCAVQDESGDTEALEVHHISQALGEHILHMDDRFAVKEPYFTINSDGTAVIRVDHPTDIILSSAEMQTTASGSNPPESRTAAEWKQVGNDLLGQKQLWKARDAYRTGLSGEADGRLRLDLARNLARVDLELTKYDEAKSSAKEAVSDGSDTAMANLDVKAYYRAATAAYNLRQYGEAQDCVDKLLKLDINDAEGKRENQRIHSRLDEQKTGQYDFDKIVSRLSPQNSRIDIADFTQRVHVAASSVGGRGIFASCDMEIGDIVLCEKAFCSTFEKDKSWYAAWEYNNGKLSMASSTMALWDEVVQKMLNNPSTIPAVTNLGGDYTGIGNEAGSVDDTTVLDTFQIRSIIESNAFGIPTPSKRHRTRPFGFTAEHQEQTQLGDNTGIFLKTAMMNHSCVPNTRKYFIGDAILIRATRPILKGEELLQSYAQTDADVGERRQMLESTWHFHCNCKLCAVEEKESDDKWKKRDTLERRANSLGMAIKNASASTDEIAKADVLLKSLKSSYDSELYQGLPRKASTYLQIGLLHHYMRQNQRSRCMMTVASLFDMLGWNLSVTDNNVELTRKDISETHIVPELVEALLITRSMQRRSGGKAQAERLEEIAKTMYLAVNGLECGWEEVLKNKP